MEEEDAKGDDSDYGDKAKTFPIQNNNPRWFPSHWTKMG